MRVSQSADGDAATRCIPRLVLTRRWPFIAAGVILALAIALGIAAIAKPSSATSAGSQQSATECHAIDAAYQQWLTTTAGASDAVTATATAQFAQAVQAYPDPNARNLAAQLSSFDRLLQDTETTPVIQSQVLPAEQAISITARPFTTCK
jgi:hypothetical protein